MSAMTMDASLLYMEDGDSSSAHVHSSGGCSVVGDTGETASSISSTSFHPFSSNGVNKLRLRVVNETTKRHKDIFIDPREDANCYEAIYDNQTIKDAHIRKWGSVVAKNVKQGTHVIQCVLAGEREPSSISSSSSSSCMGRAQQAPQQVLVFRVLSLKEMKATSTAQLSKMLVTSMMEAAQISPLVLHRILLLLQCIKKEDAVKSTSSNQVVDLDQNSLHTLSKLEDNTTTATSVAPSETGSLASTTSASLIRQKFFTAPGHAFKVPPTSRMRNLRRAANNESSRTVHGGMSTAMHPSETPSIVEVPMMEHPPCNNDNTMGTTAAASVGISLPPEVVKDVFPYHIVLDERFQILQVGNRLSKLIDDRLLLGRNISQVLNLTGPIPHEGPWNWALLDTMVSKVIFLEPVATDERSAKIKIKGTLIEISDSPKRVMLALFPDVKNLAELSSMNLTIADLPLHSCQRDAVLVGEHSASEVKLTHHLDQRHRDLINSMERQIADRTRELADANRDLEEANTTLAQHSARQLEHFACMSHEIRTPLNCIVGMTSLMMESTDQMTPSQSEAVRMINGSGELLRAVVDDVLDFARLSSGSFETVIKSADLQETLDTVVHSIAHKISEKNITLRTHYSPDLPRRIETDSRRLQQVCYNLLGNAGKFSKPGSFIDLTVALIEKAGKRIIRFQVKDYGKGIKKSEFERIFEPFSQASKETQHLYGGTGLGLSITSKLVERLGGTISVDSEEGKFAEFTVDLPFVGETVDKKSLRDRLAAAAIVFVETEQQSTSGASVLESSPFQADVISEYDLNFRRFSNCDKLHDVVSWSGGKHITLLVHEDLYNDQTIESLKASHGPQNCTVMTYGPNYKIAETKNLHFRSLSRLIPSILLETIVSQIGSKAPLEPTIVGKSSDGSTAQTLSDIPMSPRKQGAQLAKKDLKLLYAEDNKVNQKVLKKVLKAMGVPNVDIVENGKAAVDICATNTYDLIFMDMQMPVMDGLDATKLITNRDKDAKVVFVTAHALDEFKTKAIAAGGKGFVSKPFRKIHIEELLQTFCGVEI